MKAATFLKSGSPEVIQYGEYPMPIIGSDEVLIETKAIGLNFADVNRRKGIYPLEGQAPYILGYEGAGTITQVGKNINTFKVGDRVGFAHVPYANAEFVKAPAWKVIPLPSNISFELAAGILLQGLTAHYLLHDSFKLKKGNIVLIHSISGGVGLLLTQIAKILGAKVIGTVSKENKVALAKSVGADHVIVRSQDWKKEVLLLTGGRGVDVVYDAIGATLIDSIAITKEHGTVVYYGQAGGAPPKIDPNLLMADSKTLVGGELWSHIANSEMIKKRTEMLFSWIEMGLLKLPNVTKFPLSLTSEAHRSLESGESEGKILLVN